MQYVHLAFSTEKLQYISTKRWTRFSWVLARCLESFLGSPVPRVQPFPWQAEQHAPQGGILTSAALPTCCANPWMSEPASASVRATVAKEKAKVTGKTALQ